MKTVWIINHYAEPPEVGKYLRHFNFARKLKEKYKVKIFTASTVHNTDVNIIEDGKSYVEKTIDGVDFVFIKTSQYFGNSYARIKNMFDYYFGVQKVTKNFGSCDIVYSSSPHSLTWLAARKIAKRYGAKFIAETRDLWPLTFIEMGRMTRGSIPARILFKIEKSIYKSADRLIFTIPGGYKYVEDLGLDSSKCSYINNFIDLDEFDYNAKNKIYDGKEYNEDKSFKVVFTGALGKANNLMELLRAAKYLKSMGEDDIRIYLFGYGAEEENLRAFKEENSLDNVHFMGKVKKEVVPNILVKSDLNIITLNHIPGLFKYGLSPNKIFEYFAAKKPILMNVKSGFDLVEKYQAGKSVDGKSEKELAEAILEFKNMNHSDYEKYANNARKASHDFELDKLTEKLIDVFEN